MLKVSNLVKVFRKAEKPAVDGASFTVKNGEVFGLFGKNGAGKSTTIKCITGMLPFDNGKVTLNNNDIVETPNKTKSLIGYVPDNHSVYENLTGREYVNFMADVYQVSVEDRTERMEKYAKLLNLESSLDFQIFSYSHGMKQKICIMGALIHEPRLWVLDEPFLGLDVQSRKVVKDCIKDFSKNKKNIVLFTSHDLQAVIEMCDKVCVLDNGKVVNVFDLSIPSDKRKFKRLACSN